MAMPARRVIPHSPLQQRVFDLIQSLTYVDQFMCHKRNLDVLTAVSKQTFR